MNWTRLLFLSILEPSQLLCRKTRTCSSSQAPWKVSSSMATKLLRTRKKQAKSKRRRLLHRIVVPGHLIVNTLGVVILNAIGKDQDQIILKIRYRIIEWQTRFFDSSEIHGFGNNCQVISCLGWVLFHNWFREDIFFV